MKPETEKAIELAKYLQTTHVTSDPRAAEVIDDLADAVLDLADEVEKLKKTLFEACEIADENNTGNASSDDRRNAFERITELRNLARK